MLFKKKIKVEQVMDSVEHKNLFQRYCILFLGCTLSAFAFNVFFLPRDIVYGGVSGVSIIVSKLFNLDPSIFILIANVLLLILSYYTLGFETTKGSIAGSIMFPICVKMTSYMVDYVTFDTDNLVLIAIFGAIIAGIGSGTNFKSGFTTGGTDIINQIVAKYFKVSIGKAMLMSDGIIVLGAGFFLKNGTYAYENVMTAIIVLYIISLIADKVILGISQSKAFYIITEHETEVKKFVLTYLSHGVTVLDGRGGYTGNHQKVIMCIIPTKEYFKAKEGIQSIDPNAFFLVTDAYEIKGGK